MTPAERYAEFLYLFEERLGISIGQREATPLEEIQARDCANESLGRIEKAEKGELNL